MGDLHGYVCTSIEEAVAKNPERMIVATRDGNVVHSITEQVKVLAPEMNVVGLTEVISSSYSLTDSKYQKSYCDEYSNQCIFEENLVFGRIDIWFEGSNNIIRIKKSVKIDSHLQCFVEGEGNYLEIGEKTTISSLYVALAEHGSITIGKDCMLGTDIEIYQSTFHPIFDRTTGKRVNPSKNVKIGDHVWIGAHAGLMSGFEIGNGSVIGYGSISSGSFGSEVVVAGSPARVIREGIQWERDAIRNYELNHVSDSIAWKTRLENE
jgi:acetyltransferase-like isoleucine patch superfamily enzyme